VALAQVRKHLSERQSGELTLLAGFYITLTWLTETLGVATDPPMGSALIRDSQMRVARKQPWG
jgi:hypothetical protein